MAKSRRFGPDIRRCPQMTGHGAKFGRKMNEAIVALLTSRTIEEAATEKIEARTRLKPKAPARSCSQQPCAGFAERGGRCAMHSQQAERSRGSSADRGYGRDWERLRNLKLATNPICQIRMICPGAFATEVDHIIPFQGKDDPLRLEWTNLQSACKPCNSAKARRDSRSDRVRGGRGVENETRSLSLTFGYPRAKIPRF